MKNNELIQEQIEQEITSIRAELIKGNTRIKGQAEEVLRKSKEIGYIDGELKAMEYVASTYRLNGDYETAMKMFREGLALAQKHNKVKNEGSFNNWIGSVYYMTGDIKQSIDYVHRALDIYDENNLLKEKSDVISNLASRYAVIKEYDKAIDYYHRAFEIEEEIGESSESWHNLFGLGEVYKNTQQADKAAVYYNKSLKLAEKYNNYIGVIFNKDEIGQQAFEQGRLDDALLLFQENLTLCIKNGIDYMILHTEVLIARTLKAQGKKKEAKQAYKKLLKKNVKNDTLKAIYEDLYLYAKEEGNFEEALTYYEKHIAVSNMLMDVETKKYIEATEAKYQNKLKEKEKEILRLQKIEMEQKALRAQLNPHFLFNALNSIQNYFMQNENQKGIQFLQSFSALMRQTLDNSEEAFITLDDEINFLRNYLSIEQLRFNFAFNFNIEVDDEIDMELFEIPSMLLQPYVENTIKHGVNGIENGQIHVLFQYLDEQHIKCIIEDNGHGLKKKSESQHVSKGSQILQKRLNSLQEQYQLNFSVNLMDKEENGKVLGTRVEIVLADVQSV